MFYLHEPVDYDDIANGFTIHIELAGGEFHCGCPRCGAEVVASARDLFEKLELADDFESAYCPACSQKIRAERSAKTERREINA